MNGEQSERALPKAHACSTFNGDVLEMGELYRKILLHIFDSFYQVESLPFGFVGLWDGMYVYLNEEVVLCWTKTGNYVV